MPSPVDPTTARKAWRTLEPYHGMIYFVPEAADQYAQLGIVGRHGYFASRAAPMGAVSADVVVSTFFNFNPTIVHAAIPSAWHTADPAVIVDARFAAADRAIRRVLGDAVTSDAMVEAAGLARAAATAAGCDGRPLAAAHAALPWPDDPHLVLWHATSVLREHRGDGHVAALMLAGVSGVEALVMHAATGDVPGGILQSTRAWPDDAWDAAVEALASRGWVHRDGTFTEVGRAVRAEVESTTDRAAAGPWDAIGADGVDRLRELTRPWSKALVQEL
ncbi:MAG TPA: hypothetical protein VK461_05000 [Acidimicrobiales bacterium]|nr:hypothetical protein [Acidimicrobiales bacterium]